jgi:putative hemolysin
MTQFSYSDSSMPLLQRGVVRTIEVLTGQPELARLYRDYQRNGAPREDFWSGAVRRLGLIVEADLDKLARELPAAGPVVVVANHPYGVLDGIVIGWLVRRVREDFRILTHAVLYKAPEVRPWLLPVDFSGTPEAQRTNLASRRSAHELLEKGGVVVVFPAGAVSTSPDRMGRTPAVDSPWQPFIAQLIQRHQAPVLPVYFGGQNSRLFQIASHVSQTLRLSLLFKEVHDRMGTPIEVNIGDLLEAAELEGLPSRQAVVDRLRVLTYGLGGVDGTPAKPKQPKGKISIKTILKRRRKSIERKPIEVAPPGR